MRLSAEGRYLEEQVVSDRFASFAEALYSAERTAKDEMKARAGIRRKIAVADALKKEQELRDQAVKTREERNSLLQLGSKRPRDSSEEEDVEFRNQVRQDRAREIERSERLNKRGKKTRDADRDVSEQIALGQA